ncbi:MAG: hypothetical protein ICV77_15840 [Cyanobacteria bacterium Co-bin8]|nr:hypothetical protein [Cyanobacteria bacterium Co-bin8]
MNVWFPQVHQDRYAQYIVGQSGLTRRQAICFVRLWGYAYLQQREAPAPVTTLSSYVGTFDCSHSQAADLFYSDRSRGSERSAGMMIDQLVAKHLVRRAPFDGGPTRLSLQIPDSFLPKETNSHSTQLYVDAFDVRNDASLVAAFLEESYSWVSQRSEMTSFKITKVLRQWAAQYPSGLRVLRKASDDEPVGFATFFPTHPNSEEKFHQPPSVSLHLSTLDNDDPIQVALPGNEECYAVFVRSWQIHSQYWNYSTACQFLQDSQATLTQMQEVYPNLCDIYTITIHPRLEALALALGFKAMKADPSSSLRWYYTPLARFLKLDVDEALAEFDFNLA